MQLDLNQSFLIGSWALKAYGLLSDREPGDIDLLSPENKSILMINRHQVEISSTQDIVSATNKFLYEYCIKYSSKKIETPIGKIKVAPLEVLKILKHSSTPLHKAKHMWDLKSLENVILNDKLSFIAEQRLQETIKRIEKDNFFNTYNIVRFIDHDELHRYVAKVPAYTKLLDNAVHVSEEKFKKLDFKDQYLELFEESFVLAMERELLIQYKQAPILLKTFIQDFKNTNDTNGPALRWLSRLSIPGKVKDRPDWLAQWCQDNYHNYIHLFPQWWEETLENLSVDFWTRFLSIKNLEPLSNEKHTKENI